VFLQDGSNDLSIYGGDWFKANESMERALEFSGYEVNHVWGTGGHNGAQGTAVFPDAMRWLWKDWPKPVKAGSTKNDFLNEILIPGSDWELVGQGYAFTEGTAVNAAGDFFFQDIPNAKTYKVEKNGKPVALPLNSKKAAGTIYGPDGKRYVAAGETRQILAYDGQNKETPIADSINGNDLVVAFNGNIYVTVPDGTGRPGKLFLIRPNGEKALLDEGLRFPNGLALTPDQTQLYVTESATHWVWIYSIKSDGTLENKQRYGWLHVLDTDENAWPDGIRCDRDGRVYVATRMGIQVLDQLGRVNAIIPVPENKVSNLSFAGPDFDTLYISANDKVYRRKVKVQGANGFQPPIKPPLPKL
jgi:sugar lactone lactonase YvrE